MELEIDNVNYWPVSLLLESREDMQSLLDVVYDYYETNREAATEEEGSKALFNFAEELTMMLVEAIETGEM